jgi:hypothetical protein
MLILRWWGGRYLTFMAGQPLKGPDLDWNFWIVLLSGLPQFIIQHIWACKFIDGLILFLTLTAFFFPKNHRLFIALLVTLLINHFTLETYSVTHSKNSAVLYLSLLPLCVRKEHFGITAEFVRYCVIFILISAAWHKLHNGGLMNPEHFVRILVNQHADLAILRPEHITYHISRWLIGHPFIAWLFFICLFFLQALFLSGVFTKSFDRALCLVIVTFVGLTYLLMRISIFEMLAGGFVFLLNYDQLRSRGEG